MKKRHSIIAAAILIFIIGCGPSPSKRIVLSQLHKDDGISSSINNSEVEKALNIIDRIVLAHGDPSQGGIYEQHEPSRKFYNIPNERKGWGTGCEVYYYNEKLVITIYELYAPTYTLSDKGKALSTDIYNALSEAFVEKKVYMLPHYREIKMDK